MIIRATIANVNQTDTLKMAQDAGLSGTAFPSTGFGSWGVEHGLTLEFATMIPGPVISFLQDLMAKYAEAAVYVTVNGRDALQLWAHPVAIDAAFELLSNDTGNIAVETFKDAAILQHRSYRQVQGVA